MMPANIAPIKTSQSRGRTNRDMPVARANKKPNRKFHISSRRSRCSRCSGFNSQCGDPAGYLRRCRGKSRRPAEDCLCHARNEEHVDDERDENHRAWNQISKPHFHRIVAVESLLDEAVEKSSPYEDEGCCDRANHGEADKNV